MRTQTAPYTTKSRRRWSSAWMCAAVVRDGTTRPSGPTAPRATSTHPLTATNPCRGRPVRGQARWWSPYASTSPPQPYQPSAPQRRSVRGNRKRRRIATCMRPSSPSAVGTSAPQDSQSGLISQPSAGSWRDASAAARKQGDDGAPSSSRTPVRCIGVTLAQHRERVRPRRHLLPALPAQLPRGQDLPGSAAKKRQRVCRRGAESAQKPRALDRVSGASRSGQQRGQRLGLTKSGCLMDTPRPTKPRCAGDTKRPASTTMVARLIVSLALPIQRNIRGLRVEFNSCTKHRRHLRQEGGQPRKGHGI